MPGHAGTAATGDSGWGTPTTQTFRTAGWPLTGRFAVGRENVEVARCDSLFTNE